MKRTIQSGAIACILCLGFAGCETTGDPNAGGLIGWRASLADERISDQKARFARENRRLEEAEVENAGLRRQNRKLESRINETNAELSALLLDLRMIEKADEPRLAQKASSVRADIQRAQASTDPADPGKVRALRNEVESLREELRLLQERR